ncbi:glycosyltransferase family 4 protein [Flavobacterium sp. SM15]|uniref:glycosyltransferase family 4 protein n=1 Tax=Flavobacterium sp. SM15 TaxID=2908005 RepID=UPI001EDBAF47|nr:glycosyltransferase family 4 protein [Flavobacterium sp. SM15]MCG2610366.1 glycosyltransferase family 4 protein [Flavobacterium sp. SM15]
MNVLFIARATLYDSPGGDTVQLLKTAEGLRKLGVTVDIGLTTGTFDHHKYDIIHFFNIIRPADILFHFRKSKRTVISTIFVDYTESEIQTSTFLRSTITRVFGGDLTEYLKTVAKFIFGKERLISKEYLFKGQFNSEKYLFKNAGALLPNSNSEASRLKKKFGSTNALLTKIVNAIEPIESIVPNSNFSNSIICVGRIERRKNQLNLIKAVKDLDIPCYIIGKAAINDPSYHEMCKNEAGKNVHFIEALPQHEIFSIMKAARVHALPTWFETTGLVSLEAAYYGCNIVITKKGDQVEYFQDYAYYCEPDDITSIREAILKAYQAPFNEDFKEVIGTKYNWTETARQTYACYQSLMNQ